MKTKPKIQLSEKPVRRGPIFCSSWCGGQCTWAKFQLATKEADRIAKIMGKGWKPRVHENLGWHYDVMSPCRRIRVCGPYAMIRMNEPFMATLGEAGELHFEWSADDIDPKVAVQKVITKAKESLAKLGATLQGL